MNDRNLIDAGRVRREPRQEILIMGTPVAPGNRGVMALGASLVDLCSQAMPGFKPSFLQRHRPWPDVDVLTEKGPASVKVITCQLNPKVPLHENFAWIILMSFVYRLLPPLRGSIRSRVPWIRSVADSHFVGDVRGGDSFSDIYGFKRFFEASLLVFSCSLVRGSIVHFPQTYGPFKSPLAKWIAKVLLRQSSVLYARDPESQAVAQELVGRRLTVGLSPDVAFALTPARLDGINVAPPLTFGGGEVVGINVNGLVFNGGYQRDNAFGLTLDYRQFLIEFINELILKHQVRVMLVPHTFACHGDVESDNEASEVLRSLLEESVRNSVHVVQGEYDQHEIKTVIGKCDFFVGCRMHACIAALSQGIPCIGIAYSKKFKGVFDSVDSAESVIDARSVELKEAMKKALELFADRGNARPGLSRAVEVAKNRLQMVFREIEDELGNSGPSAVMKGSGSLTLNPAGSTQSAGD